ncbi:MAG: UDP-N-acetylglucosamine 1-carboxyvinyltransferase [Nitrospirae bacterium RIFCSPHIGHO2_02_FULL_42_12]|nr:MAG: UDP-N-acetylglucosamine 1-carboxyvinyltransferase [Nitrospirae bacterium RIFCSPHIGHO2_02_FULL_42_12]HAS17616.1 UDP-N-acetylglucosamine 1-carboxyvinyltransferase [Nitrospiraceae bacterium]
MDTILIKGGKKLKGEVEISGAKNSALPIIASSILSTEECVLTNVPLLKDIQTIKLVLESMGARVRRDGYTFAIDAKDLKSCEAPYELVKTMRASVLVLGPLVARFGEARVSLPGGCAIGTRPVNLHIAGLQKMGAEVEIKHGYVEVRAKRLKGANISFDISTVTGTENIMMAAVLAEGETVIGNAACEPEVVDLANFLIKRGAKIKGAGTDTIIIEGVLRLSGGTYEIMPDRIETGTYLISGAITGGDVTVRRCVPSHIEAVLSKLSVVGVKTEVFSDSIRVVADRGISAVDVRTMPYPGFPTDMQAQIMALMTISNGLSVITETVFENRFIHVPELRRMGAKIKLQENYAVVEGVKSLSGAPVMATDLRASASLVLAGLVAEGQTEVHRVYHLDRGYESMERKLSGLGADIVRVK